MVTLKDDTGYLVGCRLKDAAAEAAIGCTADALKVKWYKFVIKLIKLLNFCYVVIGNVS